MWFYKFIIPFVLKHLESHDFKESLTKEINKNLDIPMIDEETEQKVFDTMYVIIIKILKQL